MHNIIIDIIAVEKDTMPKIPQSAISKKGDYLKPDSFNPSLEYGDKVDLVIAGPHKETEQADKSLSFSVPVKAAKGKLHLIENTVPKDVDQAFISVNKTNMKLFVAQLGDDSDNWVNATFTALVIPSKTPDGKQVKGWTFLQNTMKKAGAK